MNSYQFRILDPRSASNHPDSVNLSNRLYRTWKEVFSKLMADAGATLDPDDYFRNDFALVIYDKEEILGLGLCTEFDLRLDVTHDHHYWKALKPQTGSNLKSDALLRVMSVEYLTVMPEYRKAQANLLWAEILLAMGVRYQDHFGLDALVGTPRIDLKMSQLCMSMGAIELQTEPISKMGYPCAVQAFTKLDIGQRIFPNPETQRMSQLLWEQRIDVRENISKKTTKAA